MDDPLEVLTQGVTDGIRTHITQKCAELSAIWRLSATQQNVMSHRDVVGSPPEFVATSRIHGAHL